MADTTLSAEGAGKTVSLAGEAVLKTSAPSDKPRGKRGRKPGGATLSPRPPDLLLSVVRDLILDLEAAGIGVQVRNVPGGSGIAFVGVTWCPTHKMFTVGPECQKCAPPAAEVKPEMPESDSGSGKGDEKGSGA